MHIARLNEDFDDGVYPILEGNGLTYTIMNSIDIADTISQIAEEMGWDCDIKYDAPDGEPVDMYPIHGSIINGDNKIQFKVLANQKRLNAVDIIFSKDKKYNEVGPNRLIDIFRDLDI